MKKQVLGSIFLYLLALSVSGQENEARKIDEFGNINCEEYLARADAMMIAQSNDPNSKIYIIIYEGKEKLSVYKKGPIYKDDESVGYKSVFPAYGGANAKLKSMRKRLMLRKMPLEKYVFVNGGFREDFWVEIWLVPNGAGPPKPSPTLEKMRYRKGKAQGFCLDCCG